MPYRKIAGRWTVRRQVRRVCRDKGEALKYNALIESALAKAEQELDQGSKGCCSIHGKLAEFLADSKAGMGRGPDCDKTLALHRKRLGVFDRAFRQRPLDAIGRDELERWMRRRLAGGVLPDTVNADVGALKAFARWARKKHYAPEFLPLLNVERMQSRGKLPGKNRKPPVALEIGELKRRLRRLRQEREDVGLFLGCMALLGLRPAEVAALRREDYRPPRGGDCGRLASRGIKGHADRDIPIVRGGKQQRWLAACLALGKRLGRAQPRQPLVPCQAGKSRRRPGGWTTESFDQTLKRLCGKLKINLLAYWVRHSGISYAQTRSATLASIQQMAGHSKITTQEAYTHRLAKDAMPAYEALGEALEDM